MTFWDGRRWVADGPTRRAATESHRGRDWLATALMLIVGFGLVLPFRSADASGATLTISPAHGMPGSKTTLTGQGFPARTSLRVLFDGSALGADVKVNGNGKIRTTITIPPSVPGMHLVSAVALTGKPPVAGSTAVAATTYTVDAPLAEPIPATPSPAPTNSATSAPSPTPTASAPPGTATPTASVKPAVTASPAPSSTPSSTARPPDGDSSAFVQRSGTTLTLNGSPYRFTGFTIYNANSRLAATCWDTLNEGTRLSESLDQLPGQEVFRAWFYQGLAGTASARDWTAFDKTLAVARAHGMRVIVSLSGQGGDCKDYPIDVPKFESWYAAGYKVAELSGTSYRDWVREVVTRYRGDPTVLAWQLMGEAEDPVDATGHCSETANTTLQAWAHDMAGLIKSIDPNHLVAPGVMGSGQCGASGTAYIDLHRSTYIDLCTVEDYSADEMIPGDQWNGMQTRLDQCAQLGKPLIVTEMGIRRSDPERFAKFDAKFAAQFGAGVAGILVWDWSPSWVADGFEVLPGDPVLSLLRKY